MPRVLLPCLLAATLLVGGCGGADPQPVADAPRPSDRASESASTPATGEPSPSASSTVGSTVGEQPGQSLGGARKPRSKGHKVAPSLPVLRSGGSVSTHLLDAGELPAAGEASWTTAGTGPEGSTRVGLCQQASLFDIGALKATLRVHDAGSDLRARQVVARFADAKSAWRALEVLHSWRDGCEDDVADAEVGPLRPVNVDPGRASAYRADRETGTTVVHTRLGIVRHGRWISLVDVKGDDVPSRWTARAVRLIAATF